jgi:hypothetical protein
VQVGPIKTTLKASGTKRSIPKYDTLLSILLQLRFQFPLAPLERGIRRDLAAGRGRRVGAPGKAVQVEPMKSKLKPPGTKRLKLNCDVLLSTSAFTIKLRRYILGEKPDIACYAKLLTGGLVPLAATATSEEVYDAFRGPAKQNALLHGRVWRVARIARHVIQDMWESSNAVRTLVSECSFIP